MQSLPAQPQAKPTGHESALPLGLLYVLNFGGGAAWRPFFNVYLRQAGLSGVQIGLLAGIRPLLMLLAQPLWGVGADIWGRRRTLLVTMGLTALLLLGYMQLSGFPLFFVWTVLFTLVSNPVAPIIDSVALDRLDKRSDLSYGSLRLWGAVGWSISAFLVGRAIVGRDMRLVFFFGSVLTLLGFAVAWKAVSGTDGSAKLRRSWRDAGQVLVNKQLLVFLGLMTLVPVGTASVFTFYSVYMSELGASSQLIGLAFGLQGLSEVPFYLASGAIIRFLGTTNTLLFSFAMFSLRAYLYSVVTDPLLAMMIELTHGLSFTLLLVSAVEYVNQQVPTEWRATGQLLFSAAYGGAGAIMGNTFAGYLYDVVGTRGMYRFSSAFLLALLAAAAIVWRRQSRRRPC